MTKRKIIKEWKSYFEEKGLEPDISSKYLVYIEKLVANDIPIIFDFKHLSKLLGRTTDYLASVINCPQKHYRIFHIPKRSGGYRTISVPYPALLECQYWIYHNILLKIPIHYCAHGFAKKKSIITNAKLHLEQKELLKIDLQDFFPSIKKARIIPILIELGYTSDISYFLASLCCLNNSLPQGAPTSPFISNIIASQLDKRLISLAKKFKLKYSRYADDLTFSGENIPATLNKYINQIIISEKFEVNPQKTRSYKIKGKRIVTGISVAEKELKLPREYKRQLRQEIYYCNKYGIQSYMSKKKIKKPNYIDCIIGKLNFWLSVEPENKYAKENVDKYREIKKKSLAC